MATTERMIVWSDPDPRVAGDPAYPNGSWIFVLAVSWVCSTRVRTVVRWWFEVLGSGSGERRSRRGGQCPESGGDLGQQLRAGWQAQFECSGVADQPGGHAQQFTA